VAGSRPPESLPATGTLCAVFGALHSKSDCGSASNILANLLEATGRQLWCVRKLATYTYQLLVRRHAVAVWVWAKTRLCWFILGVTPWCLVDLRGTVHLSGNRRYGCERVVHEPVEFLVML
jgi:hypothetical protein